MPLFNCASIICSPGQALGTNSSESPEAAAANTIRSPNCWRPAADTAFWIGAVDYATVAVSVDEDRTCVRFGLYLIDDSRRRLAVLLRGGNPEHGVSALLEVLAPSADDARAWLVGVAREERAACNVLRQQVLSFEPSQFEPGIGPVRFHRRPELSRNDVILPPGTLERIERQVVGVA